jgi:hypothetical protein
LVLDDISLFPWASAALATSRSGGTATLGGRKRGLFFGRGRGSASGEDERSKEEDGKDYAAHVADGMNECEINAEASSAERLVAMLAFYTVS